MNPETVTQQAIREALGLDTRVVLWRNNTGAYKKDGRVVRYGLCVGSSDLIGILRQNGRFVALEVKTPDGKASPEQLMFLEFVRREGGFAAIVRSPVEAREAITRACAGESQ